jgi:WD40 repeat protein
MSPEQVAGKSEAVGPASDVFSLGVVLYHLLAGRLPYRGGAAEVMVQVVTETPEPPSAFCPGIDPRLEAACLKAMAKAPADRFASMEEFAAALGGDTPKAHPTRRRVVALVGLSAVAVGVGVWAILHNRGPGEQPGPTQPQVAPQPRPVAAAPPVILRGHSGAVHAVAFDANGNEVLSGSDDNTVRRWNPETGQLVGKAWSPVRAPARFVFSPDGRRVLVVTGPSPDLYDTTTRAKVLDYPDSGNPHWGGIAFSANGKRVAMGKMSIGGLVFAAVWEPDLNDRLGSPLHPDLNEIGAVALSPDGKRGVSTTEKEGVRVWEVITIEELNAMKKEALAKKKEALAKKQEGVDKWLRRWKNLAATALSFTADGERILIGNALGTIFLRDPKSGDEVGRFEGHTAEIKALVVSTDGRLLLSAADDGTARLWSVETRKELRKLDGHKGPVQCVAFSADGRKALTGGKDRTVRLWDLRDAVP